MTRETRWVVMKDYYKNDEPFTDTYCILYGTKAEAETAKASFLTGWYKSWFDPAGNDYAGYDAFLYVDQITL